MRGGGSGEEDQGEEGRKMSRKIGRRRWRMRSGRVRGGEEEEETREGQEREVRGGSIEAVWRTVCLDRLSFVCGGPGEFHAVLPRAARSVRRGSDRLRVLHLCLHRADVRTGQPDGHT